MLPKEHLAKMRAKSARISQKKLLGLTLAELLVILLISSVIMVVLAPVVRKKDSGAATISSSTTKYGSALFDFTSSTTGCTTSGNVKTCNFKVPKGVKFINAVMVSGGGGGGGATNPEVITGNSASQTSSSQKTISIINGMQNVVVTYLTGGGGGGGGGAWEEISSGPQSQADCDPYDAKFLTASQNGGNTACVTKYNVGDIPSATNGGIASSVTRVSAGTNCSANSCCWQGQTSPSGKCDSSGTSYSGCNRTVCTWYAANASCTALAYNGTTMVTATRATSCLLRLAEVATIATTWVAVRSTRFLAFLPSPFRPAVCWRKLQIHITQTGAAEAAAPLTLKTIQFPIT